MFYLFAGTILVLTAAAITDVRHGKIPNILLITLICIQCVSEIISLSVNSTTGCTSMEIVKKLIIAILIIISLYPFFLLGELGAGDIKLLALTSISAINAISFLITTLFTSVICALAKSVYLILRKRKHGFIKRMKLKMAVPILLSYCMSIICGFL